MQLDWTQVLVVALVEVVGGIVYVVVTREQQKAQKELVRQEFANAKSAITTDFKNIKDAHDREIENIRATYDREIADIRDREIKSAKETFDLEIKNIKENHANEKEAVWDQLREFRDWHEQFFEHAKKTKIHQESMGMGQLEAEFKRIADTLENANRNFLQHCISDDKRDDRQYQLNEKISKQLAEIQDRLPKKGD